MKRLRLTFALLSVVPVFCMANDFPTYDRVNYVLFCMDKLGGPSFENLHTCSCRIDAIADRMPFAEYDEATIFERALRMGGEKGGVVRDNKRAKSLDNKLAQISQQADRQCKLIPHIEHPPLKKIAK